MAEVKQFCNENLRGLLEPLVNSVVSEKPKDPILYMIKWIQNYEGLIQFTETSEEDEYKRLKKEVAKFKKKYAEEDKEIEVSSEKSSVISPEAQAEIDMEMKKKQQKKKGFRQSVSAEVYGFHNKKAAFVPRVIQKSEQQKKSIAKKCSQSFIFNSLEDNELKTVIDAFEEKNYASGDVVITQGEEGDVIYLVDSGELDCERVFKKGKAPTYLKTYKAGDCFGELALLYNAPRAATIKAKTDCVLWALDRECFNNIVKDAAIKKREKYESTLKKVELLSSIEPYELGQICDALKSEKVPRGTVIIKQKEQGDKFYILEEGKAHAQKVVEEGKGEQTVLKYKEGDYFGELALLKNEPRAATVIADSECKLLVLDRMAFKRLLGPLENILRRNSENYVKYTKK